MSSVTDPVQRQLDALNAHDLEAFLDCYAPDAVVRLGDGTPTMTGRDEMRAFHAPNFNQLELRVELLNRLATKEWVVDEERTTWTGGSVHGIAIYQIRDNLIQSSILLADGPT